VGDDRKDERLMPQNPYVSRFRSRYWFLDDPPARVLGKLTWAPPVLGADGAEVVDLDVPTGATLGALDNTKDYRLHIPTELPRTLVIQGGRNVVVIGGAINNQNATASDGSQKNAGVYVNGVKGVCHLEGLKLYGSGLRDGFVLNCTDVGSVVRIQNCQIDEIHATDEVGYTDIHPDNIQTTSGPSKLHVDRFSGTYIYQAIYDQPEATASNLPVDPDGRIYKNMDFRLRADKTVSGGLPFYKNGASRHDWRITTDNVWIDGGTTSMFRYLYPGLDLFGRGIFWGNGVRPGVAQGADGTGRFVTNAGMAYVTPGYQ
jgi:hypothetical protein